MNEKLINESKLSSFREELIQCLKHPQKKFFVSEIDNNLQQLKREVMKTFSQINNNVKIHNLRFSISNEYMNNQIKQQEEFLRLMGYEKEYFKDPNTFLDTIKEVSHREHFKYLREAIPKLGEVSCCNYINKNNETACFKNFNKILIKGPLFENKSKGFCICCTREIITSIHLRKMIKNVSTLIPINKFRYKYDMKSDYSNHKRVLTCRQLDGIDLTFEIDPRFCEKIKLKDSNKILLKHEEMKNCDEYEYSSSLGYLQQDNKNYGIEGFYPFFDKNFYQNQEHMVILTTEDNVVQDGFAVSGLRECFFFRLSSKEN
jgi:hypothetical protein